MEIAVLGAGSIGSLLGGLLAREHRVTLVGREPHVTSVRASGLTVAGAVECTVHPDARTGTTELAADLVLVTTKAHDVPGAAAALARDDVAVDAVVPLLNGIGHASLFADRLPTATVIAGTTTYGAVLDRPGHVICTGVGSVTVGARDGGPSSVAERVVTAMQAAGVEATAVTDAPRRTWEKLAVNAGVNAVTALARVENGRLADDPGQSLAREAARECAQVARAEGIDLNDAAAVQALDGVVTATADNRSSMRQDVESGRQTEVDHINGAVVDRAETHGIGVPTNRTLARLVELWERGQERER
jgi:ketopantoate reductase (EC 1.1.1.169)